VEEEINVENYARKINTLEEVKEVLDSPNRAWTEIIDCLEVCLKAIKNPDLEDRHKAQELQERSQEIALELIPKIRKVPKLSEVKTLIIEGIFKDAKSRADILPAVEKSKKFLGELNNKLWNRPSLSPRPRSNWHEKQVTSVEILLEDIDQEPVAVRLASLLRDAPFNQPYLAIDLCERVIKDNPKSTHALTCYVSALLDIENYQTAEKYLDKAAALSQTDPTYMMFVRSRLLYHKGRAEENGSYLKEAMTLAKDVANIRLKECKNSSYEERSNTNLLYALRWLKNINNKVYTPEQQKRHQKILHHEREARSRFSEDPDNSFLLLTQIHTEARRGNPEEAESQISAFKKTNPEVTGKYRSQIKRIEDEIADNRKRQQQQFDLGD